MIHSPVSDAPAGVSDEILEIHASMYERCRDDLDVRHNTLHNGLVPWGMTATLLRELQATRALLREAKPALEAGANILEQQAIYEKRLDRLNWEQCATTLRKLIEACP